MSHQDSFDDIDRLREEARQLFIKATDALKNHIEGLKRIGSLQSLTEADLMYTILESVLESRSKDITALNQTLDVMKAIQTDFIATLRSQVELAERVTSLESQLATQVTDT